MHLAEEAEMVPAPGVAGVQVDAAAVDEAALGWPAGRDRPQRVYQHPGGHVAPVRRWRGRGVGGAPDVDAERGAHHVVGRQVRLEPEPTRLPAAGQRRRLTPRLRVR